MLCSAVEYRRYITARASMNETNSGCLEILRNVQQRRKYEVTPGPLSGYC